MAPPIPDCEEVDDNRCAKAEELGFELHDIWLLGRLHSHCSGDGLSQGENLEGATMLQEF